MRSLYLAVFGHIKNIRFGPLVFIHKNERIQSLYLAVFGHIKNICLGFHPQKCTHAVTLFGRFRAYKKHTFWALGFHPQKCTLFVTLFGCFRAYKKHTDRGVGLHPVKRYTLIFD